MAVLGLSCGLWDLIPCWELRVLATGPPGKSPLEVLNLSLLLLHSHRYSSVPGFSFLFHFIFKKLLHACEGKKMKNNKIHLKQICSTLEP